ncbi:MAG: penicillin-insensitive murein endopeptidase [Myxococcota bacterium]|nr:penicillin-insensitive murein endopeptidase [Myxococcota bacterium]
MLPSQTGVRIGLLLIVAASIVWSIVSYADDTTDSLDYRCEFEGDCNLTTGQLNPSDPAWDAEIDQWLVAKSNGQLWFPGKKTQEASIAGQIGVVRPPVPMKKEVPSPVEKKVLKKDKNRWPRSVSIGKPNRGWLAYPMRLETSDRLTSRRNKNFGTEEMVQAIIDAVDAVHAEHPNTPVLAIGNLSREHGGRFPPHKSHQSGRDADIGYYLKEGHSPTRLRLARVRTLDVPRTWTFIESLVADNKVEYIFSDRRLMRLLYRYALNVKKIPKEKLHTIFQPPGGRPKIMRHLKGHADHLHIRFHAPESVAAVSQFIAKHGNQALKPLPVYKRIKKGDSLWRLAKRHRVTVKKLRQWNRLRKNSNLRIGKKLIVGHRRPKIRVK